MDATQTSDGKAVTPKCINRTRHPYEAGIGLYLSSEALASNPENHRVPIYEVFTTDAEDDTTIVTLLLRPCDNHRFDAVGEVVGRFRPVVPTTSQRAEMNAQIAKQMLEMFGTTERIPPEELDTREEWWRDRYTKLSDRGYMLRPRYSPDWIPSWKMSNIESEGCEDAERMRYGVIMDATRTSDGKAVTLKRINRSRHPYEADIGLYLSSEALASDPENHCVPIYEAFTMDAEDDTIIVMPLLRPYDDPRFDTVGEVVECFRQLFEGLQFMHKHRVAHRDCMSLNIMLDPTNLYPESFHPRSTRLNKNYIGKAKHFTRTQRPSKYYFIDFGISRRYDPSDPNPREVPIWGGDKAVPEFQNSNDPRDPFATDVFYIGNAIRMDFIMGKRGFGFMKPLIATMIQEEPEKRPKMDEVVAQFDNLRRGLSWHKLRSRVVEADEDLIERVIRTTSHWKRRVSFVVRRIPAIPSPRS